MSGRMAWLAQRFHRARRPRCASTDPRWLAVGTQRWVRKDARPRFEFRTPVAGVLSPEGRQVYAARPWVMLPATRTDPAPEWNVRTRRLGESAWIVDESWTGENVETCVDPFDDAEESQLDHPRSWSVAHWDQMPAVWSSSPKASRPRSNHRFVFPCPGMTALARSQVRKISLDLTGPMAFGLRDLEVKIELSSEHASASVLLHHPPTLKSVVAKPRIPLPGA